MLTGRALASRAGVAADASITWNAFSILSSSVIFHLPSQVHRLPHRDTHHGRPHPRPHRGRRARSHQELLALHRPRRLCHLPAPALGRRDGRRPHHLRQRAPAQLPRQPRARHLRRQDPQAAHPARPRRLPQRLRDARLLRGQRRRRQPRGPRRADPQRPERRLRAHSRGLCARVRLRAQPPAVVAALRALGRRGRAEHHALGQGWGEDAVNAARRWMRGVAAPWHSMWQSR
ncbi:hypothetical protein TOPH_02436 [Tolypocladium ophioglossoides CBS 100239]|uniref:Uncharacterized protein n=1 Tax=Tolypocladium ophioglossoides (strain CBS 100239) TaxID=1163406 RepID=A0A0L0NGF1_TOLOC|nr:hypothetical protein TOPH_02436 [Tolypocladium ophioglossoides CBS 100239]